MSSNNLQQLLTSGKTSVSIEVHGRVEALGSGPRPVLPLFDVVSTFNRGCKSDDHTRYSYTMISIDIRTFYLDLCYSLIDS